MEDWNSPIKLSVSTVLLVALLAVGVWIFVYSQVAGNTQMANLEAAANYGEWDDYNGRVVDRPTMKNIVRANRERVIVILGGTRLDASPQIAHTQINAFANARTTCTITIGTDANGNVTMNFN